MYIFGPGPRHFQHNLPPSNLNTHNCGHGFQQNTKINPSMPMNFNNHSIYIAMTSAQISCNLSNGSVSRRSAIFHQCCGHAFKPTRNLMMPSSAKSLDPHNAPTLHLQNAAAKGCLGTPLKKCTCLNVPHAPSETKKNKSDSSRVFGLSQAA